MTFLFDAVKPEEYDGEELDPDNPDSLYFIYAATMSEELVIKKLLKLRGKKTHHADPTKRHNAVRI